MFENRKYLPYLLAFLIPLGYALFVHSVFTLKDIFSIFEVMTQTFLITAPLVVGVLTVYFSPIRRVQSRWYRIWAPWVPVFAFFAITLIFSLEGWACWVMILPVFMIAASLGGLLGGYLKLRRHHQRKLMVSGLALLPFALAPIESWLGSVPAEYEAYTSIDIHAPASVIWGNVTRVRAIPEAQDKGWLTRFLGLPRPVRAELNYEGVGAYRQAVFTNGLVFHETVTAYEHEKKMVFTIKADPHEIPSTTLDEHVVIGGEFFDVLNGTYELEQLGQQHYRLHLYSRFELNTTFNFYAGWWARRIMQDIQNNILQVEKQRAEMNY